MDQDNIMNWRKKNRGRRQGNSKCKEQSDKNESFNIFFFNFQNIFTDKRDNNQKKKQTQKYPEKIQ